ncbi:hypothetical protein [Klebsiella pneumoniae]|uniref:hypothetical protein n=1 Tax=Klebsiella pneumoniae TaxID=573 RepID=UPI002155B9FF|nr:hypothetical protein [Klebsiella pneumoniae]MDG3553912.1 hypothetical protein [Klebsiella pneumoniae]
MNIKEIGNVFHCDCVFSWHRGKNGNHNCADGLREKVRQLAAENVALKNVFGPGDAVLNFLTIALRHTTYDQIDLDDVSMAFKMSLPETPATDRIVAGIKADGVAEREKTITFTAAKKRTQDGVALIAIGKPYKIHNDDVIGEFFIGERGRYGVITMDRLDYFTASDEYTWEFSLREGAK